MLFVRQKAIEVVALEEEIQDEVILEYSFNRNKILQDYSKNSFGKLLNPEEKKTFGALRPDQSESIAEPKKKVIHYFLIPQPASVQFDTSIY